MSLVKKMIKGLDISKYLQEIQLFAHLDSEELNNLSSMVTVVSYSANSLIIKEGDVADALYIIISGSVQVFTQNSEGNSIILARLDENSFFGEQAYVNNLIRNASIRALTDVQLIRLDYEKLDLFFKRNNERFKMLEAVSVERSLNNLHKQLLDMNSSVKDIFHGLKFDLNELFSSKDTSIASRWQGMYYRLKKYLAKFTQRKQYHAQDFHFKYLKDKDLIFKKGDAFDYVYYIVSGSVILFFSDDESDEGLRMDKDCIFGELSLLQKQPRSATARALGNTKLIVLSGDYFLQAMTKHKTLKSMSLALNHVYLLPQNNLSVQQFTGKFQGQDTIFKRYQMPNNQVAICAKLIYQSMFSIYIPELEATKTLTFKRGRLIERKIVLQDSMLIGLAVSGDWDELGILCKMLLDNVKLEGFSEELFLKTGNILSLSSNSIYHQNDTICHCMNVHYQAIKEKIMSGCHDPEQVYQATGAGTVCGACKFKVLDIMNLNKWSYATIRFHRQYHENVYSFIIKPLYNQVTKFTAGQFISLRLQIDGLWIERAYTLVSSVENTEYLEIIVKRYDKGVFSPWLFAHKDDNLFIWISTPSGNFTLKKDVNHAVLCIAGGLGITPFIAFFRNRQFEQHHVKAHVFYVVESAEATVIPEDMNDFLHADPSVSFEIWDKSSQARFDKGIIDALVAKSQPSHIYICGGEGFQNSMEEYLHKYEAEGIKLITEEFTSTV